MSSYGHQQNGHRLTDLDVRIDAARILEELLDTRIDDEVKGHHKVRRIKTENSRTVDLINGSEKVVLRSKTLPSGYREATEKQPKQEDLETLPEEPSLNQKFQNVDPDGSGSTADTEDNLSVSLNRKKKSFFKRAKERILFSIRRNQKNQSDALKEKSNSNTANSEKQKIKKKGKIRSESEHHLKPLIKEDKSVDNTEKHSHNDNNGTAHTKVHAVKKSKGNFFSSFRKSKKSLASADAYIHGDSNGRAHHQESISNGSDKHASNEDSSSSIKRLDIKQGIPSQHLITEESSKGHDVSHSVINNNSKEYQQKLPDHQPTDGRKSSLDKVLSMLSNTSSPSHKSVQSSSGTNAVIITDETSTSSYSTLPPGNICSYTLSSIQSSVLDNPGDDIDYIDASDSECSSNHDREGSKKHLHAIGSQFNGSNTAHVFTESADRPPDIHLTHGTDVPFFPAPQPGGSHETTSIVAKRTLIVQEDKKQLVLYDEIDGLEEELLEMPQNTSPDREALYSEIAQKLIDMGDSYSASLSNKRPRPQVSEAKKPISALEMEIIECLRSTGDRASKQATQDTYQRFRSTVQNSMGNELSWSHVAFLYHTTKGVISAVGKGTRAAHLVKDFTVQYVSDTFATWIIDQGGFNNVLSSSEESDFGVD